MLRRLLARALFLDALVLAFDVELVTPRATSREHQKNQREPHDVQGYQHGGGAPIGMHHSTGCH
jgi:hypothetical protein